MSQSFLGEIQIFAFNYAPRGWAFANGQLMAINQNAALFSLLGTTYGGNGTTNFALPDLRSRVPLSQGTSQGDSYPIGQRSGTENEAITIASMPAHTHVVGASTANAPGVALAPSAGVPASAAHQPYRSGAAVAIDMQLGGLQTNGGSQPHSNVQPFLALSFCVALQGIFPSRN